MSVYVRVYQTLGWTDPGEKFLARAIAREASKDGNPREGFSVCFYGETANAAEDKAFAWIEAEREREEAKAAARRAAAEKRKAQS